MQIIRHEHPADFLETAAEFLAAREALNNIFYGIGGDAMRGRYAEGDNLWLTAHAQGAVVGAALQTPPWELAVAHGSTPAACAALVRAALGHRANAADGLRLPPRLADAAAGAVGRALQITEAQGIYQLTAVTAPGGVGGALRPATVDDIDVLLAFALGFARETGAARSSGDALAAQVRTVQASGAFVLWVVDGEVVSMAAARGPTPNGIRISWVYTPPDRRGNGYASAVVAALSQRELDAGRSFCFLFTDLANPTSNRIYQRIGYERVGSLNVVRPVA